MSELVAADLSAYTNGRLPDNDDTQDLLDAALSAARRWCGWWVTPVQTGVTVEVDGPGGRVLSLPTLNLIALTAVSECGVALDVTKLDKSKRKGTVEKYPYGCWSSRAGAISVTMTHGFTEDEAADWRRAVLRLADMMDREERFTQRSGGDMIEKRIDDVTYKWAVGIISADERLRALFSNYRILPSP
ncbi:hypothetical protein A7G45_26955 [Mycolicibacterium llatzerense]|nr:hypothetical protein [Mycolicibacterium llatzerense]MCT7366501.1 hypothetical protein [Mycolicibacterium llatzerense]